MARPFFGVVLVLVALFVLQPLAAEAQYRSPARVGGGIALAGGGVLMVLASSTCRVPTDPVIRTTSGSAWDLRITDASGAPWLWSRCRFEVTQTALRDIPFERGVFPAGETFHFDEDDLRDPDLGSSPFWTDVAEEVLQKVSRPSDLMRYTGLAVAATGVLLATVWSGSYDEPVFDIQAGPRGFRLSRTVGF